jgi:hypothetical protein
LVSLSASHRADSLANFAANFVANFVDDFAGIFVENQNSTYPHQKAQTQAALVPLRD